MRILLLVIMMVSVLLSADLGWSHNYKEALKQAKKEKKHLYMLITSKNCRWCKKFAATTLQDKATLATLNKKYILLNVDKNLDFFPSKFDGSRVPKHYFLTSNGEEIYSILGYWDSEDFASFLKDVDARYVKNFKK